MFKLKSASAFAAAAIALYLTGFAYSVQAEAPERSAYETGASAAEGTLTGELAAAQPARVQEALGSELAVSMESLGTLQPQSEASAMNNGKGLLVFCLSMALSLGLMFGVFGLSTLRTRSRSR